MNNFYTYIYDKNEKEIASLEGLVTLLPDMELEIHSYNHPLTVERVIFRYDHPDQNPGFHVYCKEETQEN